MILSIESSCDDSSIAITDIKTKKLLFHKKISQELEHNQYGGVVPELAARLHTIALPKIVSEVKEYLKDVKFIAVTTHPGLSLSLTEGISVAKAIALSLNVPIIEVNHLLGHIYSLFIEKETLLPCSVLLVSGGHTMIYEVTTNEEKIIASTMDDSFGESFDKVSKMLELGYPGGPIIEEYAKLGDENSYNFPVPLRNSPNIEFSYSGLKNAVRLAVEKEQPLTKETKQNISASFQKSAVAHLLQKCKKYFKQNPQIKDFAIVGGASANLYLRDKFNKLCQEFGITLHTADLKFCSDNAVMIGRYALEVIDK